VGKAGDGDGDGDRIPTLERSSDEDGSYNGFVFGQILYNVVLYCFEYHAIHMGNRLRTIEWATKL
jgi:hypothetical protein